MHLKEHCLLSERQESSDSHPNACEALPKSHIIQDRLTIVAMIPPAIQCYVTSVTCIRPPSRAVGLAAHNRVPPRRLVQASAVADIVVVAVRVAVPDGEAVREARQTLSDAVDVTGDALLQRAAGLATTDRRAEPLGGDRHRRYMYTFVCHAVVLSRLFTVIAITAVLLRSL